MTIKPKSDQSVPVQPCCDKITAESPTSRAAVLLGTLWPQLLYRGQGAQEESCCLAPESFAPLSYEPSTAFYSLNSLRNVSASAGAQGCDS